MLGSRGSKRHLRKTLAMWSALKPWRPARNAPRCARSRASGRFGAVRIAPRPMTLESIRRSVRSAARVAIGAHPGSQKLGSLPCRLACGPLRRCRSVARRMWTAATPGSWTIRPRRPKRAWTWPAQILGGVPRRLPPLASRDPEERPGASGSGARLVQAERLARGGPASRISHSTRTRSPRNTENSPT